MLRARERIDGGLFQLCFVFGMVDEEVVKGIADELDAHEHKLPTSETH